MGNSNSNEATLQEDATGGRACFESIYGPPKGSFLETTHGTTHYRLEGNNTSKNTKDAPLVILIHGIGGNAGVFDGIAQDLVDSDFQILRYDLYDRGYSESDPSRYPIKSHDVPHPLPFTLDLHVEQLRDVLTKLQLDDRTMILCGHSTGGVTAMGYAAKYNSESRIQGLVLIDSICLPFSKPLTAYVADLPLVGGFLVRRFGAKSFLKFSRQSMANPEVMKDFLDKLSRSVANNPRFFAAVRSTNANCQGFVGSAESEFRQCCEAKIAVHLIWGKADATIPYEHCGKMFAMAQELGTPVTEESFEDMPHNVFFPDAKPQEVSRSICNFVKSH